MIEEIPLTFVVDNTMVVGPTTVGLLSHNQALIFVRPHGILTHGVTENFSILPHVWIGKVIVAVVLESEWSFCLTIRKVFQTVDTHHLKLALAPFYFFSWGVIGKLLHVLLELGTTSIAPEYVGVTI